MASDITEINGLGGRMATRIENNTGIKSMEDLAEADPEELAEIDGISSSRADKWINEAEENAVLIKTGDQVFEEAQNLTKVKTGVNSLDEALGGGWEAGHIIAVGGDTGSGKTQIAYQSLGEAVKQGNGPAVYIETERNRYRGKRLRQMFDEEVQKQVHKVPAYDLDRQYAAYSKVKKEFDNLSMVVVDSFTHRFRMTDDFSGRENFTDRSDAFSKHLNELEQLAAVHDIPVLLTCQVYEDVSGWGGQGYVIYGGSLMMHAVNFIVMLKDRSGALSDLKIENHPEVGEEEIELQITEDGVGSA